MQGGRLGGDVFSLQNVLQVGKNGFWHDGAQIELQAAAKYRYGYFLRVGGGQYKFQVFGRLFQRFEHGVKSRVGEHVHFVNHEDFKAPLHRLVNGLLKQALHFVYAAVAGCVKLGVVDKAACINFGAGLARATWRSGNAALPVCSSAVERFGENARNGGFAYAARACKQVGVVQPLRSKRVGKRLHHVLLPHHFGEVFRTVFAG